MWCAIDPFLKIRCVIDPF